MTKIYDIELNVPLGLRKGRMILNIKEDGTVTGNMDIFGNVTEFKGNVCNSSIEIEGVLKTIVRSISYKGNGRVTDKCIYMHLSGTNNIYELTGYLRQLCKTD